MSCTAFRHQLLTLIIVLSPLAHSADVGPPLGVSDNSFSENFNPKVNVSGQTRAGYMINTESKRVNLDELYVHFNHAKGAKGDTICLRIASKTGTYTAKWYYTLENAYDIPQLAPAKYVSAFKDKLNKMAPQDLVVIATLGKDCKHKKRVYVPTSWGDKVLKEYTLFLNTDATSTEIDIKEDEQEVQNVKCVNMERNKDNIAYDTQCVFSATDHTKMKSITVFSKSYSEDYPKVKFNLRN